MKTTELEFYHHTSSGQNLMDNVMVFTLKEFFFQITKKKDFGTKC